jgi:two-component system, NtrC family, sensor kinase
LVDDFNTMTQALGEAQDEIMRQNRMLESRVKEATSELRSRNLELFQAQDELRRANRLATAGQVAAMLAHDLGSPLSSISGHLQLMLEDPNRSPSEQARLQLILNQVERLSDTIRNFLKNVTGLEPQFQNCNVNALIEHLIQLTLPVLTERRIEPVLEMDSHLPVLKADPNQLQQLFLNLFTNAIDAMKEGGQLKITTRHIPEDADHASAEIVIEDSGMGINQEHVKNLFRPFFSTKEFGKGSGLGLAICQEIVKVHGGQIEVESQEGVGTRFTIRLPVVPAKELEYEENEPARSR